MARKRARPADATLLQPAASDAEGDAAAPERPRRKRPKTPAVAVEQADRAVGGTPVLQAGLEDSNGGERRAVMETLGKLELEPAVLALHADALVTELEHSDEAVREAVVTLGKLEPAVLAQHADALVVRLEDSNSGVRREVVQTLGKLDPAALAQHADAHAERQRARASVLYVEPGVASFLRCAPAPPSLYCDAL